MNRSAISTFLALAILFAQFVATPSLYAAPSSANNTTSAPACQSEPGVMHLAFATDRAVVKGIDGTATVGSGRAKKLRFGVAAVTFRAKRSIGSLPEVAVDNVTWAGSAVKALRPLGTGKKPVLIFVHGFGEDFRTSIGRAAQVVHDGCLDVVPIVFSWPTTRAVTDYGYDRDSATYARDDLALLVSELSRDVPGRTLDLFAHSMGSRVALEALRLVAAQRPPRTPLNVVVFASADEDIDVFRRDLPSLMALAKKVFIFSSPRDFALGLSTFFAGNIQRLGNARHGDLVAHGIVETPRLKFLDGERICNPLVHRCSEVTVKGLAELRKVLPVRGANGSG